MDAGVIKCLKGFYRTNFCRQILSIVESSKNFVPTDIKFFQALEMLNSSWDDEIKPSVISNCFRHCGFFRTKCRQELLEFEDINELPGEDCADSELDLLSKEYNQNFTESKFDDFVEVDKYLCTSAPFNEMVQEESTSNENLDLDESDNFEEEVSIEQEIKISTYEAMKMINCLKLFSTQKVEDESDISFIDLPLKISGSKRVDDDIQHNDVQEDGECEDEDVEDEGDDGEFVINENNKR
ncbi:unnamed protein product, partial [Brachionus calyciflorus]